jgi:hypothetical protein
MICATILYFLGVDHRHMRVANKEIEDSIVTGFEKRARAELKN